MDVMDKIWPQSAPTPNAIEPTPGLCLCEVVAIHSVDPPSGYPPGVNYANAITYTVIAQTPHGGIEFAGVRPCTPRWPHPMLVRGFIPESDSMGRPAQILPGGLMNSRFYLTCSELPYFGPCPPASSAFTPPPPTDAPAPTPIRTEP